MRLWDLTKGDGSPSVTISARATLAQAVEMMITKKASAIIVMDDNDIKGMITRSDIMRCLNDSTSVSQAWEIPVNQVMSTRLIAATPDQPLGQAIKQMVEAGIGHLPVLEGGTVKTLFSLNQLLIEENKHLHTELVDLQTYIDALHDAPND
jgi:CBS domain-containing protein